MRETERRGVWKEEREGKEERRGKGGRKREIEMKMEWTNINKSFFYF